MENIVNLQMMAAWLRDLIYIYWSHSHALLGFRAAYKYRRERLSCV